MKKTRTRKSTKFIMEREKRLHGQFLRENNNVDWESSWQWLKKGNLKAPTEALICSAQEQSLRTNYIKHHIDKTCASPICRMCGDKGETVSHIYYQWMQKTCPEGVQKETQ